MQPTQSVPSRRDDILTHIASEYRDVSQYMGELRKAIDSFAGSLPADSPNRYLRMECGEAIMSYFQRVKSASIDDLVAELEAGGCIMGQVKGPREIVLKSVNAYIKAKKLVWKDKKHTVVMKP